jgi:hypothetical protein
LALPAAEREALLAAVRGALAREQYERIREQFEAVTALVALLKQKNLSIGRLRELIFGAPTESARHLCGGLPKERPARGKRPGHGRRSQRSYTGARRVRVPHATLRPGQSCPECRRGKLRPQKQPATTVQLSAQPPVGAVIHEMERLRCDSCGKLYTAATPPEVAPEKYDPTVGVLVGLLRYGSGMPFHRLERMQQSVGVPLPASIQWEQALRTAEVLEPVVDHLLYLGAQAAVVYNDDTPMRIAQVRKQIQAETDPQRTGIFTTGIVCEGTASSPPIRLLFTGRQHAGENLARVLGEREPGLAAPLHMCDGLSRNDPKGHATESCHCAVHARRNFVEIREAFPEECRRVVESFRVIYRVEAECLRERLDPTDRLKRHQAQSQPEMEKLRGWFIQELDARKVEPNSGLGQAMNYMLTRWETLMRFLSVPGAPLDNNITERLLKSSILHRKNSLHYRTVRGAEVGDRFMSVIETCRANRTNPFVYMLAVVRNSAAVKTDPGSWMPWNYEETLAVASANSPPPG